MQIRLDLKTGNFLETLFFQTDTGENSASYKWSSSAYGNVVSSTYISKIL